MDARNGRVACVNRSKKMDNRLDVEKGWNKTMKNKKMTIGIIVALLIVLLTGVFLVVFMNMTTGQKSTGEQEKVKDITMFSAYTEVEQFQKVPAMAPTHAKVGIAENRGGGSFVIDVDGTTVDDYKAYLITLEQAGFKKHSDNGEDGLEGYAYTASYTKEELVVTVSHAVKMEKTYIAANSKLALSDHLIYNEAYAQNTIPGAKTKVHLVQLHSNGNSFVIQLKNGHFIVHDGGKKIDAPYLVDYLEKLAPEGEKPVIEAWFISHAHDDHNGAPREIATNTAYANRILVEGIYFTEPDSKIVMENNLTDVVWMTTMMNTAFKNTKGEIPKIYRPQFGQRYYFCDITIDVVMTPEQIPSGTYWHGDFNETSIWLMHQIEGQRFLIPGDGSHVNMEFCMKAFDKEYFDVEVFAVAHHGINVYDYFVEFCVADTLLYTMYRTESLYDAPSFHAHVEENIRMKELAKESLSHGEGTVVLTFPYTVGSYETIAPWDWRYDGGVQQK